MKKKEIEKIAPVQPQKKGKYITTVQRQDNLLLLDVYEDGAYRGRQAVNTETGEYAQYLAKEQKWSGRKFSNLLDIDCMYRLSDDVEKRLVFDTPKMEKEVRDALLAKTIYCNPNTFDLIDRKEREYSRTVREKTEENRVMRTQEKMSLVPDLPEDIHNWIWAAEGSRDYAFYEKDTGKWHCSACRKTFTQKSLKMQNAKGGLKHNTVFLCPKCGVSVTAKKRVKEIEQKTHCSLLQKINEDMSVLRHFDVSMVWNRGGREIWLNESARILLYHTGCRIRKNRNVCAEIFYNQASRDGVADPGMPGGIDREYGWFDNKTNYAKRRICAGHLYPEGIEDALKDTAYEGWGRVFRQLAAAGQVLDYNRLMVTQNDTQLMGMVEFLFKGRFYRLLTETSGDVGFFDKKYYGILNKAGKTIEEVFQIPDRQLINRIRDTDGGETMVRWMRWSHENGQKIPQETLEWLSRNGIWKEDIKFIQDRMSPTQVMNYIKRQQAGGYKGKTAMAVLNQWQDYLGMLERLGKKADDEMMFRPRELKRRHDECVEEQNRQWRLEEMKRDKARRSAEARKMRERFPGAEEVLKEIKSQYEYKGEEYFIKVPKSLFEIVTEGQTLHHCAGSSDRYFDRIMQRETYICFLRKKGDPKTPFYTIEVEPGGTIRQHRGMYDEEPDIEKIKPFLKEWQKEIKKRMRAKDHELARISKAKREANIEELKAKNNTRVLDGLMEDFMEAEAI